MGHRGFGRVARAAGLALLAAAPALAADGPSAEPKNEIVVFGGASILDATRNRDATVGVPGWIGDRWPGFPDVQVRTETSLGGSALFGAGGVSYSGAHESSTAFALRFGAGLKVLFGRVGGRVDVVDHLVTDHFLTGKAEHDIHATAGFLVRF